MSSSRRCARRARLLTLGAVATTDGGLRGGAGVDERFVDLALAVAMSLVVAVVIAADLEGTGRAVPGAYLFAGGFGALVLGRRRAPRTVLVLTVLGIFGYYTLQYPPIGIALPAIVALYCAAEAGHTRWALGAAAVLIGVAAWARIADGLPRGYLFSYELLTNVTLAAAAIALGVSVRARRRLREQEEQLRAVTVAEQARAADQRVQEERMRIARDLHDAVGHTLSVITVHGNVAAEAIGRDDDAARQALERVRVAAGATMRELRTTVKVLRSPARAPERGAVGLSGVAHLADGARQAGLALDLRVDVPDGALDAAIDAAAYRIVQESLTNVLRHANASSASVTARLQDGTLEVTVVDDGRGSGGALAPGAGLAGMRERVTLLGGQLRAGDSEQGGFLVHARLPARLP